MSHPPKEIPPAELWAQLIKLPRASRKVDFPRQWPGTEESIGQICIQVLTQNEQTVAAAEAEKATQRLLGDRPVSERGEGYDTVYKNACAVELLFRACKRAEDPTLPFFPSPNAMREHLTANEVAVLMNGYLLLQDELGPIVSRMSNEEVDAWVKRLVEAGSSAPLATLSWGAITVLASSMAYQLASLQTDTSSAGSPPPSGSEESAEPSDESSESTGETEPAAAADEGSEPK